MLLVKIKYYICINYLGAGNLATFSFKYNKFHFNETSATIEWNAAGPCEAQVSYEVINILQGENVTLLTTKTSYNINNKELEENPDNHYKYFIKAFCNDTLFMRSDTSLTIPKEGNVIPKYCTRKGRTIY